MPHARVALLAGLIGQFPLSCGGVWRRAGPVGDCLDAVPGDACHKFVTWALDRGLEEHPEWFPSFKRSDSEEHNFKQIQEIFYSRNKAACGKPCSTEPDTASPPDAEVQKALVPGIQEATHTEAPVAAVEEAKPEAAPAAPAEEVKPALAHERPEEQPEAPAPAADDRAATPRSDLIGNLEAELQALGAMKNSPSLEVVRAEKRQLVHNLQQADELEAELKARHLQNLQTANKVEADLNALEAMDTSPALEILRAEKRTLIHNLQTADKSETALKTLEIQRLEDPAATAMEAAPTAPAEELKPAPAQEQPQEAEERPPRSELIGKLEGELNAIDQIHDSPALETLRAEKRQLIKNLQTAYKLEAEFNERHLYNLQTAKKLEADLKTLEAMDDTPALEPLRAEKRTLINKLQTADKAETEQAMQELQRLQDPAEAAKEAAPAAPAAILEHEAAAAGRKPWWQRRWREAKANAKDEAVEALAVAAEEAKPEAVPPAPAKEAKHVEAPATAASL